MSESSAPVMTAREHRVAARNFLNGTPGLTATEKAARMLAAVDHLNMAIAMTEAQAAVEDAEAPTEPTEPASVESAE